MDFDCWEWKATLDKTPGPEHAKLHIVGICGQFSRDGYTLSLRPTRGGANPFEPWFELVVEPPAGDSAWVMSDEPVSYTDSVSRDVDYRSVTIVFDGQPRWTTEVVPAS